MNLPKYLIFTTLALFQFENFAQQKNKTAVTKSPEMIQLRTWFTGEFDNFQQYWKEKEDKVANPHENIHSIFAPVSLPTLGEDVFYVKQYIDGDPKKIYRQRMYSFSEDPIEKAIRLDIYTFGVDSLFYDAHLKPEKLAGLTPAQMTMTAGCAVYWKIVGDHFVGYMKPKACNFVSKRSGKRIFITDSLMLNKEEIWISDQAEDEDGKYVFGHKDKIPHKLKKCKFFKGWVALQREGKENEYISMKDVILFDQGGKQTIMDGNQKTKYSVEIAKVIYGKDMTVFKLAFYEEGKEKSIAYTWASPDAKQIGLNLRWLSAGFTLKE